MFHCTKLETEGERERERERESGGDGGGSRLRGGLKLLRPWGNDEFVIEVSFYTLRC